MVQAGSGRALLATALAVATIGVQARGGGYAPFNTSLTVSADLTEVARHALVREAESIWREAGVQLRWVDAREAGPTGQGLRVLVARRPVRSTEDDTWVVGELLRFDDGDAIALASISRAEAVVRAAGSGRAHGVPDSMVQDRLGTVLGRAVAHEIGHYLLDSGAHASRGLMRGHFQPREFTDLRSGTFTLEAEARRRIQARLGATLRTIARADREASVAARRSILHW
jgi:hypothetical protein